MWHLWLKLKNLSKSKNPKTREDIFILCLSIMLKRYSKVFPKALCLNNYIRNAVRGRYRCKNGKALFKVSSGRFKRIRSDVDKFVK